MIASQGFMNRDLQRMMYGTHDRSTAQKLTLAIVVGVWVFLAIWVLLGGGLIIVGDWFGRTWTPGSLIRRATLSAAFSVYYARFLLIVFRFLRRGVNWSEVVTVASWLLIVQVTFVALGGTERQPIGTGAIIGIALYAVGSWLHTHSEYHRDVWKRQPENRGRLYTEGLFHCAVHINYFGDLVLFTGFALLTGSPFALIIPALMLAGFVFVNIPMLDSHLHDRYAAAFDEYAAQTSKLIPFLY
jgi:protein-S-isoprenylcysteine O-methyltransferase Ste14